MLGNRVIPSSNAQHQNFEFGHILVRFFLNLKKVHEHSIQWGWNNSENHQFWW
jgi:hypothetical protein